MLREAQTHVAWAYVTAEVYTANASRNLFKFQVAEIESCLQDTLSLGRHCHKQTIKMLSHVSMMILPVE